MENIQNIPTFVSIPVSPFLEGHNETINGSRVYVKGSFTEDEHEEIWQSRMREVFEIKFHFSNFNNMVL